MTDFILKVLSITARHDQHHDIWWRTDGEYAPVTFFVLCNDLFWWATADSERVTPENVGELERAYEDAAAAHEIGEVYGAALFCARVRGMRPQGAAYPQEPEMWGLFDACGPERIPDKEPFGNPRPHPRERNRDGR